MTTEPLKQARTDPFRLQLDVLLANMHEAIWNAATNEESPVDYDLAGVEEVKAIQAHVDATLERELAEAKAQIEHLRKQARDDALEGAAKICEDVADRYEAQDGGKWPELRADAKDGAQSCEYAIRAMKDKPDGET